LSLGYRGQERLGGGFRWSRRVAVVDAADVDVVLVMVFVVNDVVAVVLVVALALVNGFFDRGRRPRERGPLDRRARVCHRLDRTLAVARLLHRRSGVRARVVASLRWRADGRGLV